MDFRHVYYTPLTNLPPLDLRLYLFARPLLPHPITYTSLSTTCAFVRNLRLLTRCLFALLLSRMQIYQFDRTPYSPWTISSRFN